MPDQNLKQTMEEIKVVLRKHDCAAVVFLQCAPVTKIAKSN